MLVMTFVQFLLLSLPILKSSYISLPYRRPVKCYSFSSNNFFQSQRVASGTGLTFSGSNLEKVPPWPNLTSDCFKTYTPQMRKTVQDKACNNDLTWQNENDTTEVEARVVEKKMDIFLLAYFLCQMRSNRKDNITDDGLSSRTQGQKYVIHT